MAENTQYTGPQPQGATWDDVPQKEIDRELAYWRGKRVKSVWLVPCRYADGTVTCSGSPEFPYSNPQRRQYVMDESYRRMY